VNYLLEIVIVLASFLVFLGHHFVVLFLNENTIELLVDTKFIGNMAHKRTVIYYIFWGSSYMVLSALVIVFENMSHRGIVEIIYNQVTKLYHLS
jgi:hypothetical protein